MKISLIAAVARNGVIGLGTQLPWRLREDLRAFRARTLGHHVIAGRKTFESFGSKPLPSRSNIIVTRDPAYRAACAVVFSIDAALDAARQAGETEAFIIGGAEIYALALPAAQFFYRTRVLADVAGDVFFPDFDEGEWSVRLESGHEADSHNEHPFVIETLTRRS